MASNVSKEFSPAYSWYVVAVLLLAYTVAFIDRSILSLLVEPIKNDLQISDTQISLLAGFAFAIFYSVLGIPIARLADRSKRTAIISIGVALWSVMTAACGLSKTYCQLFLMRIGVGVGEAALSPAAYSMMADYFPTHKLAKAISVYAMGLYGGAGLALLAGSTVVSFVNATKSVSLPFLGTVASWQLTFFAVALPGVVVLALMATVREPDRKSETVTDNNVVLKSHQSLSEIICFLGGHSRIIVAHFGGFMCVGVVVSAFMVWVPEFLRRTHAYDIADAGFIYGTLLLVFGTSGPYAGAWYTEFLRRKGRQDAEMRAAYHGTLCMIPVAVLAPVVTNNTVAIVLLAMLTFALSFPQGLTATILQLVAPNRMRAQVTAIFMFIAVLSGYTIGPASVAIIADYFFRDEASINICLAIVSAFLLPIGALFLRSGLEAYGVVIKDLSVDSL